MTMISAWHPPNKMHGGSCMTLTDDWFSEMYERNYALLYRVGRIFLGGGSAKENLIEDQIQETFVRAWQKRAALQKHPNPDGWLVDCFRKCLANACRKQNQERKRTAFSVDSEAAPAIQDDKYLEPDAYARSKEQIMMLKKLLGEKDADIFLRYCVYEEKAAPIAAELGISEQALRMRVSRLKKKMLANRELFGCLVALCLLSLK